MKEYYNKHLGFKFYTFKEEESNGYYRFWLCDSQDRICDYISCDIIQELAEMEKISEEEMLEHLPKVLEEQTDFDCFMNIMCATYDFCGKEEIDKLLKELEIEEDYVGLTLEEKVKKWYEENDFSNIFGNYLVQLY